jgi:hypothetical protein
MKEFAAMIGRSYELSSVLDIGSRLGPGSDCSATTGSARYRRRTFAVIGSRGQAEGALHSRTTENSIAAAKKANTRVRERIVIIMYHEA